MPSPSGDLAELLASEVPAGVSIRVGPAERLEPPAIVIRPAPQWISPDRFCDFAERYTVIAVVTASSPGDGITMLRELSLAIINALPSPWDWESVEGPVIDETTGSPYLANRVNLIYRGGQES